MNLLTAIVVFTVGGLILFFVVSVVSALQEIQL